jgi:hypothetical protein
VLSPRFVPNGRRDDLEQNVHQQNLLNHIGQQARRIVKRCRQKSAERHRQYAVTRQTMSGNTSARQELSRALNRIVGDTGTLERVIDVVIKWAIAQRKRGEPKATGN